MELINKDTDTVTVGERINRISEACSARIESAVSQGYYEMEERIKKEPKKDQAQILGNGYQMITDYIVGTAAICIAIKLGHTTVVEDECVRIVREKFSRAREQMQEKLP